VVEPPLHVVFVCTGNRFRSALAEAVFREKAGGKATVESFGTLDLGAAPALEQAIVEAERLGYNLRDHVSRPLLGVDLSTSDLVVGFERSHVAAAVIEAGAARERSFTLPELMSLLAPAPEPRRAVAQAAAARPLSGPLIPEVEDPYGKPPGLQRRIAEDVCSLAGRLATVLWETDAESGTARGVD